jgi:hypothetical protein
MIFLSVLFHKNGPRLAEAPPPRSESFPIGASELLLHRDLL